MIITCKTDDIKISVDLDPHLLLSPKRFSEEIIEDKTRKLLEPLIQMFIHSLNALLYVGSLIPIYRNLLMSKIDEANTETEKLANSIQSGDVSMSDVISDFVQGGETNKRLHPFSNFLETIDQKPDQE